MLRILVVWLINALALLTVAYVMPSIHVDSFGTALVAAVVLGLVNAAIRPVLILLTLPATILSLGLFIFVINGLLPEGLRSGGLLVGILWRHCLQHRVLGAVFGAAPRASRAHPRGKDR